MSQNSIGANTNASNTKTCPITLNSQSNIRAAGHTCFKVKNKEGKVVQIYDAEALAEWLTEKEEYPHMGLPTPEELTALKEAVPGFVPYKKQSSSVPAFYDMSGDEVARSFSMLAPRALRVKLHEILMDKLNDNIAMSRVQRNGVFRHLGEKIKKRVGLRMKDVSFLDDILKIHLVDIVIHSNDVVNMYLSVARKGTRALRMLFYQVQFHNERLEYTNFIEYKTYFDDDHDISEGSKLIYHGNEEVYPNFSLGLGNQVAGGSQNKNKNQKEYRMYKGRKYVVRNGPRGGRYITVSGSPVYIK